MIRQTSWLLAAALLACSTGYGQSKMPPVTPPKPLEKEKHVLPAVKENSSPSAKPGKTATSKKAEQVRFKPPVIKKDPPPPPPPLPPAKKPVPPPPPPAPPRER